MPARVTPQRTLTVADIPWHQVSSARVTLHHQIVWSPPDTDTRLEYELDWYRTVHVLPDGSRTSRVDSACIPPYEPVASLGVTEALVGDTIALGVQGFEPDAEVRITVSVDDVRLRAVGAISADADGAFAGSFRLPALPADHYRVWLISPLAAAYAGRLAVHCSSVAAPTVVRRGTEVRLRVRGASPRALIALGWIQGDRVVYPKEVRASRRGSIDASLRVPSWVKPGRLRLDVSWFGCPDPEVTVEA
jgi:hypothetical protein